MAAIIAITKKIKVQRNIKKGFMVNNFFTDNTQRIVPFSIKLLGILNGLRTVLFEEIVLLNLFFTVKSDNIMGFLWYNFLPVTLDIY